MRLGFMVLVLLFAGLTWQVMLSSASNIEKKVILRKVLPMDVEYETVVARTHLNDIRQAMSMNALRVNDRLTQSAKAHADYLVTHNESSHYETIGQALFTGETPVARALDADYVSTHVSENLTTRNYSAMSSVDGLFSAIYHRFGFLSPSIDEIGVGITQNKAQSEQSAFVYLMGNSEITRLCSDTSYSGRGKYYYKICKNPEHRIGEKAFHQAQIYNKQNNPAIIVYPYAGQSEVPPAFYEETPDPLPQHEVSGFPISIEFNDYYHKEVELISFTLHDSSGIEVTDVLFMDKTNDPNQRFTATQFALFPLQRLAYDAEYHVEVVYQVAEGVETLSWDFQTQKPTGELHIVQSKNATLHLAKGKSHILYFPPHHAHDLLKSLQFPSDVDITFIDHNTFKLTMMSEDLDSFDIVSGDRKIHVEME